MVNEERSEEMKRIALSELVEEVRYEPHIEDWFGPGADFKDEDAEDFFIPLDLGSLFRYSDPRSNFCSVVYDLNILENERIYESIRDHDITVVRSGEIRENYGFVVLDLNPRKELNLAA